jgi:hypothetical protein
MTSTKTSFEMLDAVPVKLDRDGIGAASRVDPVEGPMCLRCPRSTCLSMYIPRVSACVFI